MAKQSTQPFWNTDFTKIMGDFKFPGVDVDSLIAAQQKNMEALSAANQLAFEGMQTVARRQTEIVQALMERLSTMTSTLMSPDAPEALMAKQADLAKDGFERAVADTRELTALVTKSNAEATDVLSKRVSAGLDEFKSIAQAK
ncbi:MAG: phasin family protein [Inquilinaceae bacterium]